MHLLHLGLPVRDKQRSQQFYVAYFGFDPATARECEDGTLIIRDADGFDLALHPVMRVEPSPAFLHAGFKADEPAEVRTLMARMGDDGVVIVEHNEEPAYVAFKCLDPDGHRIEVSWEPSRPGDQTRIIKEMRGLRQNRKFAEADALVNYADG